MWELDHKEDWAPKNCCFWTVVLEKTPESPGLQGDYTTQSYRKSTLTIHWKDWCWSWSSNTLVTWCKEQTHWKRSWVWERLKAKGEGDNREWDGWMASLTQWTWIWANSGRQWRTEEPGMLQSMASQRVRHDLVIEQPPHQNYKTSHCKNIQHIFSLMLRSTDCLIHCSFWRSCCGRTHHQEPWKCQSDEVTAT